MIFLNLKIDNIYMFKDTFIDFTYPKKISDSTIEGEFLTDFPNIKYKKVCILMGANASGKTTLGRVMWDINNFLFSGYPLKTLKEAMYDKTQNASFKVTYTTPDTGTIHSLKIVYNQDGLILESYRKNTLRPSKSLKNTLEDLTNSKPHFLFEHKEKNHGIKNPGFTSTASLKGLKLDSENTSWFYLLNDFQGVFDSFQDNDLKLLETILKAFDTSVETISPIENIGGAYSIKFKNRDVVIVDKGQVLNSLRLSRGTFESIEVAHFIKTMIELKDKSSTYFLDEKMAYSHSEIEIAMLNLMIEKLNNQSQLFYTTHNYDILEMNLPSHSYIFMKKEDFIEVSQPEKMGYTKNDRSLLGYVKNDVFNTLPDTSKIDDLL